MHTWRLDALSTRGVRVPITVMALGDPRRDGQRPTILGAYGYQGLAKQPSFVGPKLAWLERGGVYAWAVPVHPLVADALSTWREQSTYTKPDDWIFASKRHRGRHPFWGQAILRKHVRPVADRVGIQKWIRWHTFRHTYSTLLRSVGTEFKVMQELLRHSTLRSTLDVYTQAITPAKHAAQAAVLSLVFSLETSGASQSPSSADAAAKKGHENVPFCVLDGSDEMGTTLLE